MERGQVFSSHTSVLEVPPGLIMTAAFDFVFRPGRRGFLGRVSDIWPADDGLGAWAVGIAPSAGFLGRLLVSINQNTPDDRGLN
jgi:hypothetical protein